MEKGRKSKGEDGKERGGNGMYNPPPLLQFCFHAVMTFMQSSPLSPRPKSKSQNTDSSLT